MLNDGPMDIVIVFSCLNGYYKPKTFCNIYRLVDQVVSSITPLESKPKEIVMEDGKDKALMNIDFTLSAA